MKAKPSSQCLLLWMIFSFLVLITGSSYAQSHHNQKITQPKHVLIAKRYSPTVTLLLPTNPSTGYQWFYLPNTSHLITPTKYQYAPSQSSIVGAPGKALWSFHIQAAAFKVPSLLKIQLRYARPWHIEEGHTQTFYVITQ